MQKKLYFLAFVFSISFQLQAQFNLSWVTSLGGPWNQIGTHVATDASGNIYSVGTFSDTSDLDPTAGTQSVTPAGILDIYVVKQSSNGNLIWAKSFGGTGYETPAGIAVDTSGNIYISGTFNGMIDLDPSAASYTLVSVAEDVFVLKLNAAGSFVWGVSMGSSSDEEARAMCIDVSGNVYTTGKFKATMDFDPGAGAFPITPFGTNTTDVFISKLNTNGNFVWAVSLGGTLFDQPNSICVDSLFNVYTVGDFQGVADFDPGVGTVTLSSGSQDDAFISKLDVNGAFVWVQQIGGMDYQNAASVALDANNVYVSGQFGNTVDFDPGPGTFTIANAPFAGSPFALKLTNSGNFVWAKAILAVPGNPCVGKDIRVGSDGNVYWASSSNGGFDIHLAVYDNSGNLVKSASFPYVWNSFVVNPSAEIIITGWFYSGDFDPSPTNNLNLNSTGATDACIVKLNQIPMGLNEEKEEQEFISIYPNPNNGSFVMKAPEGSEIKITNALGQEVVSYTISGSEQKINLNKCKNGIYFLTINYNGKQSCKKFVIAD